MAAEVDADGDLQVANRGITVNCIAPGFIKTAMTGVLNEKQTA